MDFDINSQMATLLDRVQESLAKQGIPSRSAKARTWIQNKVKSLSSSRDSLMKDQGRLTNNVSIGKLYFFFYNPKLKDSLPYYDRFPLVIPIERYQDGFLGLNLHYIHPKQRIILLDKLASFANNKQFDETTKLRLTYQTIKSASRIFEAKPCIKRYLYPHLKSSILTIQPNEWEVATFLPMHQFQKAKPQASETALLSPILLGHVG